MFGSERDGARMSRRGGGEIHFRGMRVPVRDGRTEGASVERSIIGELNMYKEAGIKPNFSDIVRRYGRDRHTVSACWKAEGAEQK